MRYANRISDHLSIFWTIYAPHRAAGTFWIASSLLAGACIAQTPTPTKPDVKDEFVIHQSVDMGGNIAAYSGSGAMYDTIVNQQSGPRLLSQTLDARAKEGAKHTWFDSLFAASTGYGGDPYNTVLIRASKGKLYDFKGLFRRDRQYFDYDLFDNPLVPSGVTSNGYTFPQVLSSPHLFNTVRRMSDYSITLLPLSRVSFRASYSRNIMEGPSYSSIHLGTEGLLFQNWRNSTDNWMGAIDWRPFARTTFTYEEYISHYKGDTNWQMAPQSLNLQLSNGVPVSLGFDNVTTPAATAANTPCKANPAILSSTTTPATANPCENGFLQYSRSEPTRTIFPTEEFRFQSSSISRVEMNGRVHYTDANMSLPNYQESFNGLETRTTLREYNITGDSTATRINVSSDYGIVWQVAKTLSLSEQFDFWDFRQPSFNTLSEIDQDGSSMLTPPGPPLAAAVTSQPNFLGQRTETNLVMAEWQAMSWATVSIGYRYRARAINYSNNGAPYSLDIDEDAALLNVVLRPTSRWRVNGNFEVGSADNAYVQTSPRQWQQYQVRTQWKPREWATISGAFNDLERRDNVTLVGYLSHNRSASADASLMPGERYGIDLSYGYIDVFSQSDICYAATPAPAGAAPVPAGTGCGTNTLLGNDYYNAPTQYGSIAITLAPVKRFRSNVGYRMNAVNGHTEFLNPLQVPGSLQSQYQSPFTDAAWTITKTWTVRGNWNYYSYGEGTPIGPTLPRSFRGNVYTLGMHHDF